MSKGEKQAATTFSQIGPKWGKDTKKAAGWDVFDLIRESGAREIEVDAAEVAAIAERYRSALRADPPP